MSWHQLRELQFSTSIGFDSAEFPRPGFFRQKNIVDTVGRGQAASRRAKSVRRPPGHLAFFSPGNPRERWARSHKQNTGDYDPENFDRSFPWMVSQSEIVIA